MNKPSLETLDVMKDHTSEEILEAYGKNNLPYITIGIGAVGVLVGFIPPKTDLMNIWMEIYGATVMGIGGFQVLHNSAKAYYAAMLDYVQYGKFTKLEKKEE